MEKIEPDVTVKGFLPDDIIFMCSDGLTNMFQDEEIYSIVRDNESIACERLVQRANELGGYDNISVIIISNKD